MYSARDFPGYVNDFSDLTDAEIAHQIRENLKERAGVADEFRGDISDVLGAMDLGFLFAERRARKQRGDWDARC